ncbi:protein-L-isoaspartate(D-aspartate) O-methyltransferase [Ferruginivarius sediminum]|uniref:Protein-L-isoaspartate O-methyltransferase n=1 Tax=Ferruginivarius sediminum TaxID=2661937 RepID=A0A369TA98_9PROT|nr:protein-L-isoaspartate(D-aspartate) O-methyltransferase [Ferruginivarius sediminum]RDD61424.1 protein-L-isoaspartate(D-aspartate) O-methyltransferase [Ferruginivarius sediminum]
MSLAAHKIRLIMQLRQAGIADTAVLAAIERIPREHFVPEAFQDQAYENRTLPIGHGQTLSAPEVVATMTQALKADRRMKVLEIGMGSGYQTAVLSRLSRRVYSVERYRDLLRGAEERLLALRLHNITARVGDGWQGWPEQAPFHRIIVTAAAPEVPAKLVDQLGPGGIMVVPVGAQGREQDLLRVSRDDEGGLHEERLCGVRFVPLVAFSGGQAGGAAGGSASGSLA